MSTIVENINPISVEIEPKHSVLTQTGAIVEIQEPEYAVTVQRKEYKVVGDNIYIPKLYDDAPQWMKDLIGTVVDIKTAIAVGNLDDALEALRTLATELEVAKNTYTMSIVSSNDIDQRINTAIETLNSSLSNADATILNIAQTAVTPEEASAIAINTLSASLSASGIIGSFIANMNTAFADLDSATTENINYMESAIEAEFSANATAAQTIRTYVGIDEAGVSTGTGLSAYLEGSDGTIGGADSQLVNDIRVTAEGVESKFEYNSILNINGVYKKSGFGLTTNYTSGAGTQANPYVSEFWIDASKLKFTNSNKTGRTAPFTIDASGSTPQIYFNGIVNFSNIQDAPDQGATPQEVVNAVNSGQTTTINGGRITTGTVTANQLTATAIYGKTINIDDTSTPGGSIFNGGTLGLFTTNTQFNALAGVNSRSGGHGITGINSSSAGAGVYGQGNWGVVGDTPNAAGEWGLYTLDRAYVFGGVSPFTGTHIVYTHDTLQLGEVVSSVDAWVLNMNQTIVHVKRSMMQQDKKVVGVVSYVKNTLLENILGNPKLSNKNEEGEWEVKPEYAEYVNYMIENNYVEVAINSLGEGAILVSDVNGNIENGDYLTSDGVGTAMRQNDDVLHSYTVAKALESVDWGKEVSNTKMIACTYHCG